MGVTNVLAYAYVWLFEMSEIIFLCFRIWMKKVVGVANVLVYAYVWLFL